MKLRNTVVRASLAALLGFGSTLTLPANAATEQLLHESTASEGPPVTDFIEVGHDGPYCRPPQVLAQGIYTGSAETTVALQALQGEAWRTEDSVPTMPRWFFLSGDELAYGETRRYRVVASFLDDQHETTILEDFEVTMLTDEECNLPITQHTTVVGSCQSVTFNNNSDEPLNVSYWSTGMTGGDGVNRNFVLEAHTSKTEPFPDPHLSWNSYTTGDGRFGGEGQLEIPQDCEVPIPDPATLR